LGNFAKMGAEQSNTQLNDTIFSMKMTMKQLERLSKKAEKDGSKARGQVKKALEQRNTESARIYAENGIRKRNESLNFLRMASRLDAVCSRLQMAQSMQEVTKQMGSVVHGLDAAMKNMDLEKLMRIMDKFESQFGELDAHTSILESSMAGATTLSTPEDQVEALMKEVADEAGLELTAQMQAAGTTLPQSTAVGDISHTEDDELKRRLAELRA
jgi:charged multivesicular body protein 1